MMIGQAGANVSFDVRANTVAPDGFRLVQCEVHGARSDIGLASTELGYPIKMVQTTKKLTGSF
jgi:hypothetical protein